MADSMKDTAARTRTATCRFCDGGCRVRAEYDADGAFRVVPADPAFPAMCDKATLINEYRLHPKRLVRPLKRAGERGSGAWEEISWDEALDEIAHRLRATIDAYGPEAVAFAEMPLNIGQGGLTRRLMNHLGAVNYTAPTQLCMGNTAQVHRATYGWFAFADWEHTDFIVYFGQDRDTKRWPAEYLKLKAALARGAKLVVVDPRLTETAKLADWHLRIRYGTDAALALAWIHVIIRDGLYDAAFVEGWCTGFDELAARAAEFSPEWAAAVCDIPAEVIEETARAYAQAQHAIIPWGVVCDMQVNSTNVLRAQCILRALGGFLNNSEVVLGPSVGGVTCAQLAAFDKLDATQRAKQLGRLSHPLLTFAASELHASANRRFAIPYEPDILAESNACSPPDLFAAMRGEGPYPVRAFFSIGNNTVMSYAGQQGIVDALLNQDLVVVFENWMTPTAQLADYVLPGDMWAERDVLGGEFDAGPAFFASEAFCEPVGECRNWFSVVKGLACRLDLAEVFPWKSERELYDWRLAPLGVTFDQLVAGESAVNALPVAGAFCTPSGKVELASSILEALGFDPLPSFRMPEDPQGNAEEYPYLAFAGYRDRESYNTNFHQIERLRRREPEPLLFINPTDAARESIQEGQWCTVRSAYGDVQLQAHVDEAQPAGTLRVPHGWWKPEEADGFATQLAGALRYNDGMLFPDAAWNLDPEQGVPGLRGSIRARVDALDVP